MMFSKLFSIPAVALAASLLAAAPSSADEVTVASPIADAACKQQQPQIESMTPTLTYGESYVIDGDFVINDVQLRYDLGPNGTLCDVLYASGDPDAKWDEIDYDWAQYGDASRDGESLGERKREHRIDSSTDLTDAAYVAVLYDASGTQQEGTFVFQLTRLEWSATFSGVDTETVVVTPTEADIAAAAEKRDAAIEKAERAFKAKLQRIKKSTMTASEKKRAKARAKSKFEVKVEKAERTYERESQPREETSTTPVTVPLSDVREIP